MVAAAEHLQLLAMQSDFGDHVDVASGVTPGNARGDSHLRMKQAMASIPRPLEVGLFTSQNVTQGCGGSFVYSGRYGSRAPACICARALW